MKTVDFHAYPVTKEFRQALTDSGKERFSGRKFTDSTIEVTRHKK